MSKTILLFKKYKALAIIMGVFWAVWAAWSFMLDLIFNLKMPFELFSQLYFGLLPLLWGGLVLCMINYVHRWSHFGLFARHGL